MTSPRFLSSVLAVLVVALAAGCGSDPSPASSGSAGAGRSFHLQHYRLKSVMVGRTLREAAVHSGDGRPLLVLLHGRGSKPDDVAGYDLLPALDREGKNAPNVVLVNGDGSSYYHDRASGRWGSYVLSEAIPDAIRRLHADGRRVAIGGISMGGFGALDLARLEPNRFCAVGGHSPALFETAAETAVGAFDDEADFRRHDLFAAAFSGRLYRVPVWLDMGQDDPLRAPIEDFGRLLWSRGVDVTVNVWPGSHDPQYWAAHMQEYVDFYVEALRSCK